jgi:hypothetical protein
VLAGALGQDRQMTTFTIQKAVMSGLNHLRQKRQQIREQNTFGINSVTRAQITKTETALLSYVIVM